MAVADVLTGSGMVLAATDGGTAAGLPFAVITIVLAILLFAREIATTTRLGTPRIVRYLSFAIVPLLVLFVINLVIILL
jgi:hypothetical protein